MYVVSVLLLMHYYLQSVHTSGPAILFTMILLGINPEIQVDDKVGLFHKEN